MVIFNSVAITNYETFSYQESKSYIRYFYYYVSLSSIANLINVTLLLKFIIVLSACVDWYLIQIAQNRQAGTKFCYFDLSTAVKYWQKETESKRNYEACYPMIQMIFPIYLLYFEIKFRIQLWKNILKIKVLFRYKLM